MPNVEDTLNERLAAIIDEIDALLEEAKESGAYDDPGSIKSLSALRRDAEVIHQRWMGEDPAEDHEPAKLLDTKPVMDNLGGKPFEAMAGVLNSNPFGGQTFKMKAPNEAEQDKKQQRKGRPF